MASLKRPSLSLMPSGSLDEQSVEDAPPVLRNSQSQPLSSCYDSVSQTSFGRITSIPPLRPPRRYRSYQPVVSSPLNPTSPKASSDSDNSGDTDLSASSKRNAAAVGGSVSLPSALRRPSRLGLDEMPESSGLESRSSLGLAKYGLGYSRYPDSNRSSSSETCLAQDNGSEVPLLPATSSLLARTSNASSGAPTTVQLEQAHTATLVEFDFPIYISEKEEDDDMHMPAPDDDVRFRPKLQDFFHKDMVISAVGTTSLILGMIFLFIIFPALSYSNIITVGVYQTPLNEMYSDSDAKNWTYVNSNQYPLLTKIRMGLIDPDTPESAKTVRAYDGTLLKLVYSDEFNVKNRTFYPGDDPYWFAPDIWYGATQDMEWYDPDAVTTYEGTLRLQLDAFMNHNLNYRSGMLNSWNQLCFKGGRFEVSVSLPGPGGVPGLWPGVWSMGNLGRPGYKATTEGVWPYTYNTCDVGITPNQSQVDGLSYLPGQKLSACTCAGEDHPTPGTGRGAPEIDVFEAGADPNTRLGLITQSYQVAPYDIWWHPDYEFVQINNYNITQVNGYTGGPFQQAISCTSMLNREWYDGEEFQKYAYEYTPGSGSDAHVAWFVGSDLTFLMKADAIGPNGNIQQRVVTEEPMSLVLNLGFSTAWTLIDYVSLVFPTVMQVDYVRWYQEEGKEIVTCDPPGYETTEYIKKHPIAYNNVNLTRWDETGYGWPKHKLNTNC